MIKAYAKQRASRAPWSALYLGKGPGLQLTAQRRDLVVIIGKSFKPPAQGVPAVKAQTSARVQTQGRSVPGSTSLGGLRLLGRQRRAMLGSGIYCSSAGCHVPLSHPLGARVRKVGACARSRAAMAVVGHWVMLGPVPTGLLLPAAGAGERQLRRCAEQRWWLDGWWGEARHPSRGGDAPAPDGVWAVSQRRTLSMETHMVPCRGKGASGADQAWQNGSGSGPPPWREVPSVWVVVRGV